jgi:phage shock protein A
MGIFKRVSDIISANLNDMVDGLENPARMLAQAVREMELAIDTAKPEVAQAMANEKLVSRELQANEQQMDAWHQRAIAAVNAGDDELGRKALARKREYDKVVVALRDQHEAAHEATQVLRHQFEAMQAKLADAKRRLGTLAARKKAAEARSKAAEHRVAELNQNPFDKFDRLQDRVERAEAEAEAMSDLAKCRKELERVSAVTDPCEENVELEAELAALKKEVQIGLH